MVNRTPASRRRQAAEQTRRMILAAAKQLYMAAGSGDVSTRALASAAGVAEGTIFCHFPDKSSLVVAALNDEVERALAGALGGVPAGAPCVTKLLHVARSLFLHYSKQPDLSRLLVKESLFVQADHRENLIQPVEEFIGWVSSLVEAEKQKGLYDARADAGRAARTFFAAYFLELIAGLGEPTVEVEAMCSRLGEFLTQWETGLLKRR